MLLDAPAKYPTPYQVAWQKLKQDWMRAPSRYSTGGMTQSIASRLGSSWSIIEWMVVKEMKLLGRSFMRHVLRDAGGISMKVDEMGTPFDLASIDRIYANALKSYRLRRLDCRGILFRADPMEDERPARTLDGSLGWDDLFTDGFEIIQVTGDHLTMLRQEQHILKLAREMGNVLNQSCA